jgi:hypothetical protein
VSVKGVLAASAGLREVVGKQRGAGSGKGGAADETRETVHAHQRRKVGWIDDAEGVVFVEKGLLVDSARLDIVDALYVGDI